MRRKAICRDLAVARGTDNVLGVFLDFYQLVPKHVFARLDADVAFEVIWLVAAQISMMIGDE